MCIRDRVETAARRRALQVAARAVEARLNADDSDHVESSMPVSYTHLTAADERSSVDLGGRRIITKKKT